MKAARGLSKARANDRDDRDKRARDASDRGARLTKEAQKKEGEEAQRLYRAALDEFTVAVQGVPASAPYYSQRAHCFARLGQHKLALFDYTVAIQIDEPKAITDSAAKDRVARYYGNRGQSLRALGKLDDSVTDFKKARWLEPENGVWYLEMGISYYDLGFKDLAIEKFSAALDKSLKSTRDRCRALVARGNARRELRDIRQSIDDLKAAVELEESAPSLNVLGLSYFDNEEYALAQATFQRAAELDNKSAIYLNNLGLASFQREDYEAALSHFKAAHDRIMKPSSTAKANADLALSASIFFNRGNAELALGNYDNALFDFDQAITRAPDDENIYHSRGIVFQERGDPDSAIEMFRQALRCNPTFKASLFHLGLMYHVKNELFLAMDALTKALKLDPTDRRAYESLGLVYCDLLYFDLALGAFSKAIALQPENGVNYFYRGKALLWLGRYDEAIDSFNEALNLGCDEAQVYNCRALALKYTMQHARAVVDLTHAIEMDRSNVEYWYNRSLCYVDVGQYDDAANDLTEALKSDDGEAKLYYLRGKSRYALKRYDDTIADLRKALELDPGATDAHDCHYFMAIALANCGSYSESLECATRAVNLQPNNATYVHERAKVLQHEGQHEAAVVDFTKVIALQPLNAHAYFRRAFSLKAVRRFDEAAEDFETARKLQPDNPNLVVSHKKLHDIEFTELCAAGDEPPYETMVKLAHPDAAAALSRGADEMP